jgi:hypothetical protein
MKRSCRPDCDLVQPGDEIDYMISATGRMPAMRPHGAPPMIALEGGGREAVSMTAGRRRSSQVPRWRRNPAVQANVLALMNTFHPAAFLRAGFGQGLAVKSQAVTLPSATSLRRRR